MSQTTSYRLYTDRRPDDPRDALRRVLLAIGAQEGSATAWEDEDHSWRRFLERQEGTATMPPRAPKQYPRIATTNVPEFFPESGFLAVDLFASTRSARARAECLAKVSPDVRDQADLCDFVVGLGYVDMLDASAQGEVFRVGRPYFRFSFFGYGLPAKREEFQRQVGDLEEIRAIRRELEEIVGPLQEYLLLSY